MNFDVSKYDVILSDEQKFNRELLKLSLKLNELANDFNEEKMEEICSLICLGFKYSIFLSHYAYENAKDLNGIDSVTVTRFLKDNQLDIKSFSDDYCSNIDCYAKTLLMAMIIEDEGIDISKIKDMILLDRICCSDFNVILDILGTDVSSMNPSNYSLVKLMSSEDASVAMLGQNDIDRLNMFHDKFVQERIYPCVTTCVKEDEKVLKHAKKLGYKFGGSF